MTAIEEWKTEILGNVTQITMGQSPDSKYYSEEENGLPFLQGCAEFQGRSPRHTSYCSQAKKIAKIGSILFSVRAPVGRINIANRDYIIGRGLAAILGTEIDQTYLEHYLTFIEPRFRNASQGSTFEAINSYELYKWPIKHPSSKLEQTKIAEILSTVDRAIEQTEALIAKQQRIKIGLMQDLLIRGIDEHGNLRSEQTHNFKDSPLGRIPVEWEVKRIEDLLAYVDPAMRSGPFGSALLKEELVESGIPLLGIDNVFPEEFVPIYRRFVPPKKAERLKRYRVRPNDIMITIMGTVGRCCVVPDDIGEALSSKHVWTISLNPDLYSPYLVCAQINYSPWVLNHFARDQQGGIMAAIKSDTLRSTLLPVPPVGEIEMIEAKLKAISTDTNAKGKLLAKLRSFKTALMQDLLTGKKRVKALLNNMEVADA